MTRDDVIKGYMMNEKNVIAEMLYDTITMYESRTCESCKHWSLEYEGIGICPFLVCPKVDSYTNKNFGCNKWEKR